MTFDMRLLLFAAAVLAGPMMGAGIRPVIADDGERLAQQARALLAAKCLACHGNDAQELKGELDLRSRTNALRGGESGEPALVPGSPEKSPLYQAVTRANPDRAMPPKENDRLSPAEVELVRRWIAAGARWPSKTAASDQEWGDGPANGVHVTTSGGQSPEWDNRRYDPHDLWALEPIRRPPLPRLDSRSPDTNPAEDHPIDRFVREKQLAAGLEQTAPPADKTTLIRRVAWDLTGLPPTTGELEQFLRDDSPLAFQRFLDRLLASPRYGEQQARHWLDVARYADTSGFSNDFERPNAWRYRDYVIRSFNEDKPHDQFVLEQLAGDEMKPGDPEMKIAVGFLRMGPWEHTGMTVAAITRQQYLDDVTHHVGVTFLATGLRCARCHDHKFDPVPTRDYYRIQACFATTHPAEVPASFLPQENTDRLDEVRRLAERRLEAAQAVLSRLNKQSDDATDDYLKERGVKKADELPPEQRPKRRSFGLSTEDISTLKVNEKRQAYFLRETYRGQPFALTVYSGPENGYLSNTAVNALPKKMEGEPPVTCVLVGGALETPAEPVAPGVLSAPAARAASPGSAEIPSEMSGRRLALARWIASPDNSLTARVIVNRIWQQHFSVGLVATANNFGKMGDRPSHPELLDWLAAWFIEHDWSIKELHRLILTSRAYQRASTPPPNEHLAELDPRNRLLTYYPSRRLTAEEIRDGMLAVAGELSLEMGGPGIFPEIAWEVALQPRHIMGSVAPAYQPSRLPGQRNRRTIYAFRYRTLEDPMLEVFNRPGSEVSCERRDATTVATQVFALFNGQSTHRRSLAFAARIAQQSISPEDRIKQAFRLLFQRNPAYDELVACEEHWRQMLAWHRDHPSQHVPLPDRVEQTMIEEQTGEAFRWIEELDVMKNYVPDLAPSDVSPEVRALSDLCLVLFNSNEFLTVR